MTDGQSPHGTPGQTTAPVEAPMPVESPRSAPISYDLSEMEPWREYMVILFNDEAHSQEDVVAQLVKALDCSEGRAYTLMMTAHNTGRAVVAMTHRSRAEEIAQVLREIGLMVQLRQIN